MTKDTTGLPEPLVPAEVDLRDFQYMELDVRVLRDSRFAAQVSGDGFRAGVLLWCAAWHQVPAGSVPDDDIELANLAGYGRFVKEWRKVRDEALMQFTKCSDGRLYHSTVCEKALQAWDSKLHHHYDRARDRLRKANKARVAEGQTPLPEFSFERWNELRLAASVPMEKAECSAGTPQNLPPPAAGIPPENALRGNGEGTEREQNGDLEEKNPSGSRRLATTGKRQTALTPTIPCPYGAIVDAYHRELPTLPKIRLRDGPTWDDRQKAMRTFWGWVLSSRKSDGTRRAETAEQALEWIAAYFRRAADNDFVMGRSRPGQGHEGWRADLEYLLSKRGLKQVIEKTVEAAA